MLKHLILLKVQRMMDIKANLLQWSASLSDKKTSGGTVQNEIISNKELAEELKKLIIRKFKKRKVQSSFIDNIWGADIADMQSISKFNENCRYLLCVIDTYSKYAWVIIL